MSKTWEQMSEWECDEWIAVNVMGWRRDADSIVEWWVDPAGGRHSRIGRYSTSASDDYAVLRTILDEWGSPDSGPEKRSLLYMFSDNLHEIWYPRKDGCMGLEMVPLFYLPGDYSHAAFLSLTSK